MATAQASTSSSAPDLDALFAASLAGYRNGNAAASSSSSSSKRHFGSDEDMIRLDGSDGKAGKRKPTKHGSNASNRGGPSETQSSEPISHTRLAGQDKGKGKIAEHLDRLEESGTDSAQGRQHGSSSSTARRTAGSQWFDMPAFPTSSEASSKKTGHGAGSGRYLSRSNGQTAEEMRREVQAIRLRNALDPKRFYKGGAKNAKDKGMPEFAQLGKIISSPLEPNNTLARAERGNTVVEELMKDAQTSAYAKRKYGEHQVRTSAGGKGHYKAKSKKPKDRKRMRK